MGLPFLLVASYKQAACSFTDLREVCKNLKYGRREMKLVFTAVQASHYCNKLEKAYHGSGAQKPHGKQANHL
jgi:hypothetical protein